jgi:HTH-type transcriptional regulator/antitoxin HipB
MARPAIKHGVYSRIIGNADIFDLYRILMKLAPTMRSSAALGRAVRDARRGKGWTQGTLASKAGVSQPTVSNFERGAGDASLSTLWKLLAALDRELAWVPRGRRSPADAWDD